MEKIAFKMQLKPGCARDYQRRHDEIWPELVTLLRGIGIRDYSIHLDEGTGALFAVMWCADPAAMTTLPGQEVIRRWWAHMADLMETGADDGPVTWPLQTVFHLQ